jgi:K+-sensing histidine kinase KdpD/ActR/RegA family two-component response regulator
MSVAEQSTSMNYTFSQQPLARRSKLLLKVAFALLLPFVTLILYEKLNESLTITSYLIFIPTVFLIIMLGGGYLGLISICLSTFLLFFYANTYKSLLPIKEPGNFIDLFIFFILGSGCSIISILYNNTRRQDFESRSQLESLNNSFSEQIQFNNQIEKIISEPYKFQNCLEQMTELLVPYLADFAIIAIHENNKISINTIAAREQNNRQELLNFLNKDLEENKKKPFSINFVITHSKPFICENYLNDSFKDYPSNQKEKGFIQKLNIKSFITLPLIVRDNTIGTLTLATTDATRAFTSKNLNSLTFITRRIALASDHANLYFESKKARTERDKVISVITHDLKNPIAAIQLGTQLLLDQVSTERDTKVGVQFQLNSQSSAINTNRSKKILEGIDRQVKFVNSLLYDLSDLSKIHSGKIELEYSETEIESLINCALKLNYSIAEKKNVKIKYEIENNLPKLYCDRSRILHGLSNILENAIKFTQNNGQVQIKAKWNQNSFQFCIIDTSQGLSTNQIVRVFDCFWQNSETSHLGKELGLYIAKGVIEAHKGKIWIQNDGENGNQLCFSIPYIDYDLKNNSYKQKPLQEVNTLKLNKILHVLLVDDSVEMLEIMGLLLRKAGIYVTEANSVDEAMAKLKETRPDIIVSDIEMPHANGYDLIKRVHQLSKEAGGQTPIAALTAHYNESEFRKIEAAGFDLRLQKPIKVDQLITAISKLGACQIVKAHS